MSRIAVAVSGGVDSLCALAELKMQKHDVFALHARFFSLPPEKDPLQELQAQCDTLRIPLHIVHLEKEFEERVIIPFLQAYADGHTPNPCALCNARIKFGLLWEAAQAHGAEMLATGHYANLITHSHYGTVLSPAQDKQKDQSYFLALVPPEKLARCLFPLAHLNKKEVVTRVQDYALTPPLPHESQEICFIPNDAYRTFLEQNAPQYRIALGRAGSVFLPNGRCIGTHHGLWQYTEGQRKGLGIAWSEPLYVLRKEKQSNSLIVGSRDNLNMHGCTTSVANIHIPHQYWPEECFVRLRYRQSPEPASVSIQDNCLQITLHSPSFPAAPGQLAAVYDSAGCLLAGGIINHTT